MSINHKKNGIGRPAYEFVYSLNYARYIGWMDLNGHSSVRKRAKLIGVSRTTIQDYEKNGWPELRYLDLLQATGIDHKRATELFEPERVER
jgi:hypothetical protein